MAKYVPYDGKVYKTPPRGNEHPSDFNANCWEIKGSPGHVECAPRDSYLEVEEDPPVPKPFLEVYGQQVFFSGLAASLLLIVWWTFTRRPPLRNNLLIGGATLGAFILNPIAGAIVLAAWIYKAK